MHTAVGAQVNTFRTVMLTTPEDLLPMVYLCTNRVAAPHDGMELGVGDGILLKVGGGRVWVAARVCVCAGGVPRPAAYLCMRMIMV